MNIQELIKKMSLHDKLMQITQLNAVFFKSNAGAAATGPMADLGITEADLPGIGSTLNFHGTDVVKDVQDNHMKADPNKIPMMFMMDVVHGCRTIYPIPLAMGASFDPDMMRECAAMAARESVYEGIQVTFGPMVDLVRDARWGRVMETTGEDPYLNCLMAKAQVEGFQGDMGPENVAACVKHFAAYGAAEAGRDYNTVDMSERTLREYYLPAYKAAVDAGVKMVMTSFNIVDGVPASGNKHICDDILRKEWGFDGVIISDYNAFGEQLKHAVADGQSQAAYNAMMATNDVEMMSSCYLHSMEKLIAEGKITMAQVDKAVERLLKLKEEMGLFDNVYGQTNEEKRLEVECSAEHRDIARRAAEKAAVLLKNDGVLPIGKDVKSVALIGPFADTGNIMGFWRCYGDANDTTTIAAGVKAVVPGASVNYEKGVDGVLTATDESGIEAAVKLAEKSDVVILTMGEPQDDSGEGNSKLNIEIPEIQYKLLDAVMKVNKNVAVLLFTGRPLAIKRLMDTAPAVLNMWQPGTEGGSAAANLLFGITMPQGKLPMSFPVHVGQCPIYYNHYNTGRPRYSDDKRHTYCSSYIDGPNKPLLPFGFGMGYTTFEYSDLKISSDTLTSGGKLTVSATVTNTGKSAGVETAQLYIRDLVGSVVRPVKELKGFEKLTLEPGASAVVSFDITEDMLAFYGADLVKKAEKGDFHAFIGGDSTVSAHVSFKLI